MFIFWGTKLVRRKVGFAADFCPICREIRSVRVDRLGMAGHLYYVSVGQGRLVGHDRTCLRCGTAFDVDPARYRELAKAEPKGTAEALVSRTFPDLRNHWGDRLRLEERVAGGPAALDEPTRRDLVREPFLLLAPQVEQRFAQTHVDAWVGAALASLVALPLVLSAIARAVAPRSYQVEGGATLAGFALGLAALLWTGFTARGRWLRKRVYPRLATALRPLQPSQQELEWAVGEVKRGGHALGKKARVDQVEAAIRPAPAVRRA